MKKIWLILELGSLIVFLALFLGPHGAVRTAWADPTTTKEMNPVALKIGDKAPEFSLYDGAHKLVNLKDFRGKYVVLYFYPKDFTPGCTQEACDFRDHAKSFAGLNAVVVGISHDSEDSHTQFAEKYGLPFVLLADPDAKVLKAYGVWQEKSFLGKVGLGTARTTYVVDPEGKIAWIFDKVKVAGHVEEVLNDLKLTLGVTTGK
jgi:thioredoxin-dependent peroxiredoxin